MTDRASIEREIKEKLAEGEAEFKKLKIRLDAAGDKASDEAREALQKADDMLERGKAKLQRLADAADHEFDEVWADVKEDWTEVREGMADGWHRFTRDVKDFFG